MRIGFFYIVMAIMVFWAYVSVSIVLRRLAIFLVGNGFYAGFLSMGCALGFGILCGNFLFDLMQQYCKYKKLIDENA